MSDILTYHEFVQEKLKYMERYTTLIKDGNISPEAINHALASYQGIGNWITSEYEAVCLEYDSMKEEYQCDFDDWYLKAKAKINDSRTSSKFASNTEIETQARVDHREEYLSWKKKLIILERKVSLFRRIMDNWKLQKDCIVNIAQNSRAEMKSLGIQNLVNYEEPTKIMKRKLHD